MHLILIFKIFCKAVSAQRAHSRFQWDPGTLCTLSSHPTVASEQSWCSTTLVTAGTAAAPAWVTQEMLQSHHSLRNIWLPSFIKAPSARCCVLLHRRDSGWFIHYSPCALSFRDSLGGAQGSRKQQGWLRAPRGIPQAPSIPRSPMHRQGVPGPCPDLAQPEALEWAAHGALWPPHKTTSAPPGAENPTEHISVHSSSLPKDNSALG